MNEILNASMMTNSDDVYESWTSDRQRDGTCRRISSTWEDSYKPQERAKKSSTKLDGGSQPPPKNLAHLGTFVAIEELMDTFKGMMQDGGKGELRDVLSSKLKEDPKAYMDELSNMRKCSLEDKKMKKLKKLYQRGGKTALKCEFEYQFDETPTKIQDKMLELGAPSHLKRLYEQGRREDAMTEFKRQFVRDKVHHVISVVDDEDFRIMRMISTGEGLRIPPNAILRKAGSSEGDKGNEQKLDANAIHKQEIRKTEDALRDALQKNDNDSIDAHVEKLKELRGIGLSDIKGKK